MREHKIIAISWPCERGDGHDQACAGDESDDGGTTMKWECPQCGVAKRPDQFDALEDRCSDCAVERPPRRYCDACDGVGWQEGGKAIQTTCDGCGGTGVVSGAVERC